MSLQESDQAAAAVAVAPRVTLADIEGSILRKHEFTAAEAAAGVVYARQKEKSGVPVFVPDSPESLLSVCLLVMRNGFTVIGKSAPASPANFNAELGRKFAYEDAVRQLWPLMGFALRDRLHHGW